jgi:hypothetical protein
VALDLITEFERLIDALNAEAAPYAVCGGLALAVHGHPRATKDIDLLVLGADLDRILEIARRVGFDIPARKMIFGLKVGAHREVHRVSKIDPADGGLLALDLLVVNPELQPVWDTQIQTPSADRTLRVVSREGLATMKRLAGRGQDLVDIAKLEGRTDDSEES